MKPVLAIGNAPQKGRRPSAGAIPDRQLWAFSLRFWRQAEYFGVGDKPGNWFISLCERLAELCSIGLDEFLRDTVARESFRFHAIEWDAKGIPVKHEDFDWVPSEYRDNPEEFPFFQFHVSKALGRVVGFFDERMVFNVVVLDPHHNIQPSKYSDYKVRPTRIGQCQFSSVVQCASQYVAKCAIAQCQIKNGIETALETKISTFTGTVVLCSLSDEYEMRFAALQAKMGEVPLGTIIEMGLLAFENDYPANA